MNIVAIRTLRAFWGSHPEAEKPLRHWISIVSKAAWTSPAEVRSFFNTADFVADNRIIFDIGGNDFRLVTHIRYREQAVLVKFVGTHKAYDKITAETVNKPEEQQRRQP